MLRTIRRPTVLFALTLSMGLALTTTVSSTAQASIGCKSGFVDGGVGQTGGLVVSGAGCTTARRVQAAFLDCIFTHRATSLRRCERKTLDELLSKLKVPSYRCSDRRRQRTRNAAGEVLCKRGRKTVAFTYRLPGRP